jgi:NAD(P)-dependent dehydrogenase (short-subunit alcohol dehydrogenase family)
MARLADRVALVTGAGRPGNIGLAVCEAFLREGATGVVATDLRTEDAAAITESFVNGFDPDRFLFLEHDVTSEASWRHVLDITLDRFNGLDVLVNNAGIAIRGSTTTLSLDDFRKVMAVNLDGAFLGTKLCAPLLAQRARRHAGGAAIINVSSMAGYMPNGHNVVYHTSKSALRMLTMCTSKELGPQGIRVNSIHPGPIVTPLLREAFAGYARAGMYASAEEAEAQITASSPLNVTGRPEDMAHLFVYLASDEARFVTGTAVAHDGGVGTMF